MFNLKKIFSRTDNPDNLAFERYPFEVASDAWKLVKADINALNNSPLIYQVLAHVAEAGQYYENGNPGAFAATIGELHHSATNAQSPQVQQAMAEGIQALNEDYPEFGNEVLSEWAYLDAISAFGAGTVQGFSHAIADRIETEPEALAALKRMDERQYERFVKPYAQWMLESYTLFLNDMNRAAQAVLRDARWHQEAVVDDPADD